MRCGVTWPVRVENPKQCPSCKSPYWNIPRTRRLLTTQAREVLQEATGMLGDVVTGAVVDLLNKPGFNPEPRAGLPGAIVPESQIPGFAWREQGTGVGGVAQERDAKLVGEIGKPDAGNDPAPRPVLPRATKKNSRSQNQVPVQSSVQSDDDAGNRKQLKDFDFGA